MGLDPVSWGLIIGAAVSATGSVMKGNAAKSAATEEGNQVQAEARLQARQIRRLAREQRGAADAAYAGAGVDISEGTPLIAEHEITQRSEEDALFTILGAKNRAASLRKQGKAAQKAGYIEAAGTILGAAGSMGGGGWQKAAGGGSAFNGSGGLSGSVVTGSRITPGTYA